MGTLFKQRPRQDSISSYVATIETVLRDMGKDPASTTPDWWVAAAKVLESATYIQSADVLDEQLAGFGEILSEALSLARDASR